jgi:hypothetical protein
MNAARTDTLAKAEATEASPFHATMAAHMVRQGVLRRLPDGYLVAVRPSDLPVLEGMRAAGAGRIAFREWDGVHLAEIGRFADVIDAEMLCTLLKFPEDFDPGALDHGPAPLPAEAARPEPVAPRTESGPWIDDLMRKVAVGEAPADPFRAQLARDIPEIRRILVGAGAPV